MESATAAPGRQERRRRRTRATVRDAALRLFDERGYRETTMAAVAEAADVALRTVTVHFPTKADLLFDGEPFALATLDERLRNRPAGETALHALRGWMHATMRELGTASSEVQREVWERRGARARIISADAELRARARAGYLPYEELLAAHIARDLGTSPDALAPRLAATTAITGLRELYLAHEARTGAAGDPTESLLALVDEVLAFVAAGLDGIRADPPGQSADQGTKSAVSPSSWG